MERIKNGRATALLPGAIWQKSRYSNPCGSCVEVAHLAEGRIAVRNSRQPGGPVLILPRAKLAAFIHGATVGGFHDVTDGNMA